MYVSLKKKIIMYVCLVKKMVNILPLTKTMIPIKYEITLLILYLYYYLLEFPYFSSQFSLLQIKRKYSQLSTMENMIYFYFL